jgi:AcrR family transcriptional regulator
MSTASPEAPADPDPELSGLARLGSPALRAAQHERGRGDRLSAGPAVAFRAARRRYLACERIDMRALAAEVGVSRATLYRWTGHREQLISDVVFSLSDDVFEQARRDTAGMRGAERLLAVFRHHVGVLVRSAALQAFLRQETHMALRILTSRGGSVQVRTVARLADLYREEAASGAFRPRADPDVLAYAVVRITEGFIYNDAIAAVEPAVDEAAAIISLLLGEPYAGGGG